MLHILIVLPSALPSDEQLVELLKQEKRPQIEKALAMVRLDRSYMKLRKICSGTGLDKCINDAIRGGYRFVENRYSRSIHLQIRSHLSLMCEGSLFIALCTIEDVGRIAPDNKSSAIRMYY